MRNSDFIIFVVCAITLESCIFVQGDTHVKGDMVTSDSLPAFASKMDSMPLQETFQKDTLQQKDALQKEVPQRENIVKKYIGSKEIDTRNIRPKEVINFAKTLIGTPYRYGSTDPKVGVDCSGFFTYVFTHFKILVPRSSIDFTEVGEEVTLENARPGDLILFTGTDSTERFVGHMGMIVSNDKNEVSFIHSTSGKQYGVTITPFSNYYRGRYLKTIRVFKEQ